MATYTYYLTHKKNLLAASRNYKLKIKAEVLTHYGNGKCACVICGEGRIPCLTVDHIEGNGRNHLGQIGTYLTHWLKNNDYPYGYRTLCMNCQFIERQKLYDKL